MTTVYSLSGITELYNPRFGDEKVLLSYQNKIAVRESGPPSNPEKLTEDELQRIRSKLNSIHTQEVLFISDKINFEVNSATILPSSHEELEKIVKILREKDARIRIEGHTDNRGRALQPDAFGARALSIRKYLSRKGSMPKTLPSQDTARASRWPPMRRKRGGRSTGGSSSS